METALFKLEQAVHGEKVTPDLASAAVSEVIEQIRGKAKLLSDTSVLNTEIEALGQILTGINKIGPFANLNVTVSPEGEVSAEVVDTAKEADTTPPDGNQQGVDDPPPANNTNSETGESKPDAKSRKRAEKKPKEGNSTT